MANPKSVLYLPGAEKDYLYACRNTRLIQCQPLLQYEFDL